jgi:hypothetical protein
VVFPTPLCVPAMSRDGVNPDFEVAALCFIIYRLAFVRSALSTRPERITILFPLSSQAGTTSKR